MAPINYQHQQDRHLEDGLAAYGDEKAALKGQTSSQTPDQPQKPKFRIMNPRRFTVTFGLGLLVGFGLISASRSRPHRSLCSGEIHASNEHEMKALVEQTKDDTSALSDILRCASPETFHRLVGVYFPERNKPEADSGRAEAIGTDETWLLTAWDKLVKRQDEGAGDAATPSDSATDNGAGIVTETTTVTNAAPTSSDPPVQDSTTTDPGSDPVSTTTETLPDTSTEESTTSVEVPPTSSTSEELPESTTEALPTTSSTAPEETSSSEEPVESSTQQPATETTSSSSQAEPKSSTSEEVPPPPSSTSTSSSEPAPTAPQKTTTSDEEPDRPSKTTIHMGSSAVKETITSTREDGGTTTITSTSWVAVDPPEQTDESESDPSLQDAGLSLRANVGPVLFVGGLVTMLLMA